MSLEEKLPIKPTPEQEAQKTPNPEGVGGRNPAPTSLLSIRGAKC